MYIYNHCLRATDTARLYVYVITPFRVWLLVYKPAPEGVGFINRNNTIKGVIKCLLPVARLRDAFATCGQGISQGNADTAVLEPEGWLRDSSKV